MDRDTRIAIVGAGLGGLTLAALLQRAGYAVTLFEQTAAFSRIGAGIILSANVAKVLRSLDLEDDLVTAGILPDAFVSRDGVSGATLFEMPFDAACAARYGGPFVNIHRAELHRVLRKPCAPETIRPGHALRAVEPRGEDLRLIFANGATHDCDIVVGADGIRSKVRDAMLGPAPPRFIGRIAPRAIFPASRLAGMALRDCVKWWGVDRHVLTYFMSGHRDEIYVMAAIPADHWDGGDGPVPGNRDEFVAAFDGWHVDLRRIVEGSTEIGVWPIYDRPRDDRWHAGRMVLMGDACHPMRPFMAAGGAMAIEDAAILYRCIDAFDDPEAAFAQYAATRIPRVGKIQQISIDNSWMRGPTEDVEWFYGFDAWTTPLMSAPARA